MPAFGSGGPTMTPRPTPSPVVRTPFQGPQQAGGGVAAFAQPRYQSAPNTSPNGTSSPIGPHSSPPSPGSAAAYQMFGPQLQGLQAQQANTAYQQSLNGLSLQQQNQYARQQYGTDMQGLGLQQQDLGLQGQNLTADANYLGASHGINVGNYQNDILYDNRQAQYAQGLYNRMMQGYNTQRGANGTIMQQLHAALGGIHAQQAQARAQFGDQTQQLGEQVGASGAYGSRGAGLRQGFIQSTLDNSMKGLNAQQAAALTQRRVQLANLNQQIAQTLNQKQTTLSLADRRRIAAQYGIQQADADYNHGMAGNSVARGRLGVQSQQLGVQGSAYHNALQNAIQNAGLNYDSDLGNTYSALAQYPSNQQQLYFQQQQAANTFDQTVPASQGGTGPG